ncbi:hypothetical protein J7T55_010918 [Diaporthe amygdali]|uniref:uncharacterized protein n=1 Tax=Phomopsis amygdali TaxID=1214568 RepID=UPI0022FE7E52|nr:uncharacterized protein J7T55_010918 [Diaporthe amygdali]KAJ0104452.1 hypothetical protein J7T55_010918 [Diaporthe amygdali]
MATVQFKCTIKSKHAQIERESVLLKGFRTKIREKYRLPGEITIHRPAWNGTTRQWGLSPVITENELILKSGETIIVLYDERVQVAPGGYGTGADIRSGIGTAALAEGGYGTGGKIDGFGNFKGGHGVGGDVQIPLFAIYNYSILVAATTPGCVEIGVIACVCTIHQFVISQFSFCMLDKRKDLQTVDRTVLVILAHKLSRFGMKVGEESQVRTEDVVGWGDRADKGTKLSEKDPLSMTKHLTTKAATLLLEVMVSEIVKIIGFLVLISVNRAEELAPAGLRKAGMEAKEAAVAKVVTEAGVGTAVGHLLVLKHMLRESVHLVQQSLGHKIRHLLHRLFSACQYLRRYLFQKFTMFWVLNLEYTSVASKVALVVEARRRGGKEATAAREAQVVEEGKVG